MEFLDSDNRLLTYNGKVASRDIVQVDLDRVLNLFKYFNI